MPLRARRDPARRAPGPAPTELLEQVGLERADAAPARATCPAGSSSGWPSPASLAHDPPVLLADEPTAHLDYLQVEGVIRLLRDLADAGRTVVVATHDDRLLPLADRVVELDPAVRGATTSSGARSSSAKGEVLFRQGEPSDLVYVVEQGEARGAPRAQPTTPQEVVATVGPGPARRRARPAARPPPLGHRPSRHGVHADRLHGHRVPLEGPGRARRRSSCRPPAGGAGRSRLRRRRRPPRRRRRRRPRPRRPRPRRPPRRRRSGQEGAGQEGAPRSGRPRAGRRGRRPRAGRR